MTCSGRTKRCIRKLRTRHSWRTEQACQLPCSRRWMGEAAAEDIIAKEASRAAARKGVTAEHGAGLPASPTVARKTPAPGIAVRALGSLARLGTALFLAAPVLARLRGCLGPPAGRCSAALLLCKLQVIVLGTPPPFPALPHTSTPP